MKKIEFIYSKDPQLQPPELTQTARQIHPLLRSYSETLLQRSPTSAQLSAEWPISQQRTISELPVKGLSTPLHPIYQPARR